MPYSKSNNNFHLFCILAALATTTLTYNASLCSQFSINNVYYTINPHYDNRNIVTGDIVYNLCNQIEVYCNSTYKVVNGSLIRYDSNEGCLAYRQFNI